MSRIVILGIGQMGASAAVCFSRAGFPTLVWARNAAKLDALPAELAEKSAFLDRHFGAPQNPPALIERTTDLDRAVAEADIVLECVAEDRPQKISLLAKFQPAAARGAILTTCTSGLPVGDLGRGAGVGRRIVGAHFWNPPHLMPVVEVIRGEQTDEGLVETVSDLLRRSGKIPVVCKDVPGFVGNRLLHAMFREALYLVQEGVCSAADLDQVVRYTFALRMPAVGPCENMDLVGHELVASIQSYLLAELCDHKGTMPVLQRQIAQGESGMRAGKGFFDWDNEKIRATIARRDEQIVRQLRALPPVV